ncbi:pentapeptide repeat-containing protein [Actinoplanes sp. NPDC023936]|uniref:pentapeptide repeat-containing protein n=1 Tax=Actinoplanes sp. NPDC023936 TaxID=3154910 RepID=UPI0033EC639D
MDALAQRGSLNSHALSQVAPSADADQAYAGQLRWPWLLSNAGILTISLLLIGVGVAALTGMWLIAGDVAGPDRAKLQIEALKYGLGFFAGSGAIAALLLAVRRQQLAEYAHKLAFHSQHLAERSYQLARESQLYTERDAAARRVTDLYASAAEQLGHPEATVRLAGVYALERVAQDNPSQRQAVVSLLCACLRMPFTPPTEPSPDAAAQRVSELPLPPPRVTSSHRDAYGEVQVRLAVQDVLSRHLRRVQHPESAESVDTFWPGVDLDLSGAALVNWDSRLCHVRSANFYKAHFFGESMFGGAVFSESADFREVAFSGEVSFAEAVFLGGAVFDEATFAGFATFTESVFDGEAFFRSVVFSGLAVFVETKFAKHVWFNQTSFLGHARFMCAKFLSGAVFRDAIFSGHAEFRAAVFLWHADFLSATFCRDGIFELATFSKAPYSNKPYREPLLAGCYVAIKSDSCHSWPAGWSVRVDPDRPEFGKLVLA